MGGASTSTRPKANVSYNTIRGDAGTYDWPNSDAVAADSFMGRLRQKTGLATLDLPSEEEWEYAARAGVTTRWLCGDSEEHLGRYAWYKGNAGAVQPVGELRANAWGLYDVHGNAGEWCLDRTFSGDTRVVCGGMCFDDARCCAFALRTGFAPSYAGCGFRLFLLSKKVPWQTIAAGSKVAGGIPIGYAPHGATNVVVTLDGKPLVRSDVAGVFVWQPQTLGKHTLAHIVGTDTLSATYNVVELDFWAQPAPNPPMAEDAAIAITPVTGEIPQTGGSAAIVTSGSGAWTAAVSDGWISLSATSGVAGKPIAYVVGANADVEERVGYVYVAGHVHTVRQKGLGAEMDRVDVTVERDGGMGTVTIQPADAHSSWRARPNCDWISVSPTSGTGPAEVTYQVAPWHEASMRLGTITVGGQVFYVTQRACGPTTKTYCVIDVSGGADAAMYPISYLDDVPTGGWTDEYKTNKIVLRRIDKPSGVYYAGVFEVTESQWDRVMGGGTSVSTQPKGSVTYNTIRGYAGTYDWPGTDAVAADSFMGRLRQKTGLATLDLPSEEEWEYAARAGVTTRWLCGDSETGLGDYAWYYDNSGFETHPVGTRRANACGLYDVHGNVSEWCLNRWSSDNGRRVLRGGAYYGDAPLCAFSYGICSYPSNNGPSCGFRLFLRPADGGDEPQPVHSPIAYENLRGATHANPATYEEGVSFAFIAPGAVMGYTFTGWMPASITAEMTGAQTVRANWRANAYRIVYSANGGMGTTAPTDCAYDADATVAGSAFMREGYVFRGWATKAGGEVVYAPGVKIRNLTSNDGGVVILYAVWKKVDNANPPSESTKTYTYCVIDLSGGADAANYPISFLADVPTGGWTDEYKTNKIVLRRINKPTGVYYAGIFEITEAQWANVMGGSSTSTKPKGSVSYSTIRGDVETYDWPKTDAVAVDSFMGKLRQKTGLSALDLPSEDEWEYAARAGVTTKWLCGGSETGLGDYARYMVNSNGDGTTYPVGALRANAWGLYDVHGNVYEWCLGSGDGGKGYRAICGGSVSSDAAGCDLSKRRYDHRATNAYYDFGFRLFLRPADGGDEPQPVRSPVSYENLKGATHANPATYEEGTALAFSAPGAVTGYTFTGWMPASITAEMTGAQTVRASWRANAYRIVYSANGGTGTTAPTDCAYDADATVAGSAFVREGYVFRGWATEEGGEVVYAPGAAVRNLTSNDGGVVTLYAVWENVAIAARTYCVIDLSGGSDAANYPVSYLDDVPTGGWTDEYKTKKIVLRWINKPSGVYYAGVFEVTEAQWVNVMGGSSTSTKPKGSVSYNAIRGDVETYDWPSLDAVAADSFMGRLRQKTGLATLDLPSEEEWEYAARAGVTTKWLCGNSETGLGDYAWYSANSGNATHPVGTLRANAWGLYDVLGNVSEWCLDRGYSYINSGLDRVSRVCHFEIRKWRFHPMPTRGKCASAS